MSSLCWSNHFEAWPYLKPFATIIYRFSCVLGLRAEPAKLQNHWTPNWHLTLAFFIIFGWKTPVSPQIFTQNTVDGSEIRRSPPEM